MARRKSVTVSNTQDQVQKRLYQVVNFTPDRLPERFQSLSKSKDQTAVWMQIKDMKPGDVRSSMFGTYDEARRAQAIISELAFKLGWQAAKTFDTMKKRKKLPNPLRAIYSTNIVKATTTTKTWKVYVALTANES